MPFYLGEYCMDLYIIPFSSLCRQLKCQLQHGITRIVIIPGQGFHMDHNMDKEVHTMDRGGSY